MPFLAEASFDRVVANYVLMDVREYEWDSPRPEDRAGWFDDDYFVRRAGYIQWGTLKPFLSFHRPPRDYIAACKRSGLELRDLDEPEISEEGERDRPGYRVRLARRVPFWYVLKFLKPG